MIIGNTSQEGAILFDLYDPLTKTRISPPPADDGAARAIVKARLETFYYSNDRSPRSDDVIAFYQQCAREDGRDSSLLQVLKELFGDSASRHYAVRKAEEAARKGRKDIFYYQYGLPLMPPNGPPGHATELSIVFGTFAHLHYRDKVGDGELQQKMSRAIIEAFSTFAANGRPASPLLPSWPSFQSPATNVMVLGENEVLGQVRDLPKYKQLSCLDDLAAMRP
jgi:carboxylesterase type B